MPPKKSHQQQEQSWMKAIETKAQKHAALGSETAAEDLWDQLQEALTNNKKLEQQLLCFIVIMNVQDTFFSLLLTHAVLTQPHCLICKIRCLNAAMLVPSFWLMDYMTHIRIATGG